MLNLPPSYKSVMIVTKRVLRTVIHSRCSREANAAGRNGDFVTSSTDTVERLRGHLAPALSLR